MGVCESSFVRDFDTSLQSEFDLLAHPSISSAQVARTSLRLASMHIEKGLRMIALASFYDHLVDYGMTGPKDITKFLPDGAEPHLTHSAVDVCEKYRRMYAYGATDMEAFYDLEGRSLGQSREEKWAVYKRFVYNTPSPTNTIEQDQFKAMYNQFNMEESNIVHALTYTEVREFAYHFLRISAFLRILWTESDRIFVDGDKKMILGFVYDRIFVFFGYNLPWRNLEKWAEMAEKILVKESKFDKIKLPPFNTKCFDQFQQGYDIWLFKDPSLPCKNRHFKSPWKIPEAKYLQIVNYIFLELGIGATTADELMNQHVSKTVNTILENPECAYPAEELTWSRHPPRP